ncbi:MAG TPA: hypothetical protein H9818_00070, partial [Candidatus Phocaeicola gallistercoris]|nr:hypothetical protein [Candidatus Phocaeicola gallistercoris]
SFVTPMVLPFGGRVGSRRFTFGYRGPVTNSGRAPFFVGVCHGGCPGHALCFFNESPFMVTEIKHIQNMDNLVFLSLISLFNI